MDEIKPAVQHVIEALQAATDVDGNEEKAKRIMAETRLQFLSLLGDKPGREVYLPTLEFETCWNYYMRLPVNYDELAVRIKVLLWRYGKAKLSAA